METRTVIQSSGIKTLDIISPFITSAANSCLRCVGWNALHVGRSHSAWSFHLPVPEVSPCSWGSPPRPGCCAGCWPAGIWSACGQTPGGTSAATGSCVHSTCTKPPGVKCAVLLRSTDTVCCCCCRLAKSSTARKTWMEKQSSIHSNWAPHTLLLSGMDSITAGKKGEAIKCEVLVSNIYPLSVTVYSHHAKVTLCGWHDVKIQLLMQLGKHSRGSNQL